LPANGIGLWLSIGEILSLTSVCVNCAIIFFTSNALDSILIKYTGAETNAYKFMMIVMIEHIIIAFKYGLTTIINDKPTWVKEEEDD
jgi:hypothetical protein